MVDRAFEIVKEQLLGLELDLVAEDIALDRSLLELGLDSLKFVDLTVGLEEALGVEEFPMQQWVDQRMDAGQPLTVGALADACGVLLKDAPGTSPTVRHG